MKKALLKDSFKEIRKTFKRFISILVMALLGVGFFAGLRATAPDMALTLDKYADDTNLYDIKVISTLGLTDDDVEAIKKIENIENVYPSYDEDVYVTLNENDSVVKVIEYNESFNKLDVIEGSIPSKADECVIDSTMAEKAKVKLGDYIEIREDIEVDEDENNDTEDEDDISDEETPTFKNTKLKVVGIVTSPLYMSVERDISSLGNGKVDYFIFIPKDNIDSEVYTSIYLSVANTKELHALSNEYQEKIDYVKEELEGIKEERQTFRYNSLIDEANEKLDDAEKEFEEEKKKGEDKINDAKKEIADGKKEIQDAKKELADGEKELQDGKNKFNEEILKAENELNSNYEELTLGEIELTKKEAEAEIGFADAKKKQDDLKLNLDLIIQGLETIEFNINLLNKQIAGSTNDAEKEVLKQNLEKLKLEKAALEKNQQEIIAGIKLIDDEIIKGRNELELAKKQILDGYKMLDDARSTLNNEKAKSEEELRKAENEIQDAKVKLKDAEDKLLEGEKELLDAELEFDEEILKAENKLIDARTKVNDIKKAKWYIYDRTDLSGYNEYDNNVDNIDQIAKAFPIVFFVIATLISLTSMTRMVEEQRVQIGTLKALGYTKIQIAYKYIIYATLATVIGGTIGMCFGFQFFPRVIIYLYEMMYIHMEPVVLFNTKYAIIGLGAMLLCMDGATIYAAYKELNAVPAELMRPKAPKLGKRVFLEKISFIWDRLSFIQKVTFRNMFRYKKRFLMTIIGIAGCTALILAGYGLQDSISHVIPSQYDDIYNYDMMVYLNDTLTDEEIKEYDEKLEKMENVKNATEVYQESASMEVNNVSRDIQMVVVDEKEFSEYVTLFDINGRENELKVKDGEIIITNKLAELLDVNIGDEVSVLDSEKEMFKLKITGIAEHYISHYMYLTENTYEEIFNKEKETNILYVNYDKALTKDEEHVISEELLKSNKTLSVILVSNLRVSMDDTLKTLNIVVYILIIAAGLLAFVVLYNLSNVNISERIRELATIKVLGFYDKEVYDYITRETILLTGIGIIIGLLFGNVLSDFILTTCEVDMLRFPRYIKPISMVLSSGITIVFSVIVNFITYFALKKVDMIESLKSIE